MTFKDEISRCSAEIGTEIDRVLARHAPSEIATAMSYAISGGKRLRGFFVVETARLFGIEPSVSRTPAVAIEALHGYSLVHDDLPCMDDDDLRRGQPTVHKKWDEATAVLTGDALQTLAFQCLAETDVAAPNRVELISTLARAAGADGMVLGQAQDIAAETANVPLTLTEITELQRNKTGALIEWSCISGAIMAGKETQHLAAYAAAVGLAFQIADDILDVEGDAALAGKRLQKDANAGKATFVSLLGLDAAKDRAADLVATAEAALDPYGAKANLLREAARFVISRDR